MRKRFQFSLAFLLGVVAFCAFTSAAMSQFTRPWATAFYSLTVCVLMSATISSLCVRRSSRVFWAAFACCGWGYFFTFQQNLDPSILATTVFLEYIKSLNISCGNVYSSDQFIYMDVIYHSLVTLAVGVTCGVIAQSMHARVRSKPTSEVPDKGK